MPLPLPQLMLNIKRLSIRYNGWTRSHTRLTNQIKGYCRMFAGEIGMKKSPASDVLCKQLDKIGEDAIKGTAIKRPAGFDEALWDQIEPLLYGRLPIAVARAEVAKLLEKTAAQLPIAKWIEQDVGGVAMLKLGLLVGAVDPGKCETVAKFWFMLSIGIAKDGLAQRRWASSKDEDSGDPKWQIHKYSPQRRSMVWNMGDGMIKAQVRRVKDTAGEDTGERRSLGIYGQKYLDRKAYERERSADMSDMHVHRRAQRYMEKAFLRDLWLKWNDVPWVNWKKAA